MVFQDALFLAAIAFASFTLAFYGAAVGMVLGHLRLRLLLYYLPSAAAGSATNLAISGLGALTGTLKHFREGRVSGRVLLVMGVPSMLGAVLGAHLLVKIDPVYAKTFIGGFIVFSGVNLLTAKKIESGPVLFGRGLRLLLEIVIGLGLGVLAATTGLMMGMMRLPMMIRWLRIDPRVAIGSNMAIGFLTAAAGSLALWGQGGVFHLKPLLVVGPPTVLGSWMGARWTGRFNKEALTRLAGWVVVLTGVAMVGEGTWRLCAGPIRAWLTG